VDSCVAEVIYIEMGLHCSQVLSALLAQPEGGRAFLALQTEFLVAACSDDFIAGKTVILSSPSGVMYSHVHIAFYCRGGVQQSFARAAGSEGAHGLQYDAAATV
jgi:hypothetical protein